MPKKKVSRPATKVVAKPVKKAKVTAKKAVPVKKVVKRTTPAAKKATTLKNVSASKPIPKKVPPAREATAPVSDVSLGRPLVTQEEKLYMLFHDDYHSRQVFEFLRVQTVKELEQFSPQQIIHLLSKPIRMTVDRIRTRLAKYKRSLKDDEAFAADYGRQLESKGGGTSRP